MRLEVGRWIVQDMTLTRDKINAIWGLLQRHTTLFSDLTRGDPENFVRSITSEGTMWFEVREQGALVGIIFFNDMHQVTDVTGHMVFFDRRTFEKLPVIKQVVIWMFDNFPIHRITVTPPDIYTSTIRLMKRLGFTQEGTKRESVLLSGKWRNQIIFGMTRPEAEALRDEFLNRQDTGT